MVKISCLIFSINEYELIRQKINLLYPYFDEIVIIDSSTDKLQKKLMKRLENKKVRVVWLPPLGMADFFYYIGIKECKGKWILLLDSDDTPNKKLLKSLKKLTKGIYDAYRINRGNYLIRFFKKESAYPTGIIHWVMMAKGKVKNLDDSYKIISERKRSLEEFKRVYLKHVLIDAIQNPLKILMFEKIEKEKLEEPKNTLSKLYDSMLKKVRKVLKLFPLSISVVFYNLFLFFTLISFSRSPVYSLYPFAILRYYLSNPAKYILASKLMYKYGVYKFLDLDSKYKLLKNAKKLKFGNNGLENFLKLLEYKLKYGLTSSSSKL
ncbi:MAG: glycosyltransferase [Candidatus Aenigmatarchaeota archaeon]